MKPQHPLYLSYKEEGNDGRYKQQATSSGRSPGVMARNSMSSISSTHTSHCLKSPAQKKKQSGCHELTNTYTFTPQTNKRKYTVAGRKKLICAPVSRRLWHTTPFIFSNCSWWEDTGSSHNTILLLQCRSVFSAQHSSACCSVKRLLLQVSKTEKSKKAPMKLGIYNHFLKCLD